MEEAGKDAGEFQFEGFILIQETGGRYRTNENGEFTVVDLEPGTYTIRVSVVGHEAIPLRVKVNAGEFAEVDVVARRTSTDNTAIISQEYSVFIPCSLRTIENGRVLDCTFDQSGDSYRAYFVADYTEVGEDAYALVTEMLANQAGTYRVQIRNGVRWASETIYDDATYSKIILYNGETNEEDNWYGDNVAWNNDDEMQVILFAGAELEREGQDLGFCCGLGLKVAVRGTFVQTLFIGKPAEDVESYAVLQ